MRVVEAGITVSHKDSANRMRALAASTASQVWWQDKQNIPEETPPPSVRNCRTRLESVTQYQRRVHILWKRHFVPGSWAFDNCRSPECRRLPWKHNSS